MFETLGEILRDIYLAEDKMKSAWKVFDKVVMNDESADINELEKIMMEIGVIFIDASLEVKKLGYERENRR